MSDPAGVSIEPIALCGRLLSPSNVFLTLSAGPPIVTRLIASLLYYGLVTSLGSRLTSCGTLLSPRLDPGGAAPPFPGREFHQLEAPA